MRPIMTGDRLNIEVAEAEDLTKQYAVASDGTIDFGLVGRVSVAELNIEDAADKLEQTLESKFFKQATVKISIAEFVEGDILVMGEVQRPGEVKLPPDSIITLMEAISKCGGLGGRAASDQVRILRWKPGAGIKREVITVDIRGMFDKLDFSRDQFLRPRDIVLVPGLGQSAGGEFLALGEVSNPGFHPVTEGLDVIRAVTGIGGLDRQARLDSARILRPEKNGQYRVIPIDLNRMFGAADMSMNQKIFAGDILFIPSADQAASGRVYLLGAVERRGAIPISLEREATLAKTLLGAGGIGQFGDASKVKILRVAPDGSKQTLIVDVERIWKTGAFEDDVQLRDEDVIIVPERLFLL